MITLSLSAAELALFEKSLWATGYQLRIIIQILTLAHTYITDVSPMLLDGQVNYDYNEDITSSATMTLKDPDFVVGFDTSSPSDNALYADRMIRIVYSVKSELLPKWVDVPIFCGPVTKVKRDDALLSVECQDKAALLTAPSMAWTTKKYAKGSKVHTVLADLAALFGEKKLDIPSGTRTLSKDHSLTVESVPWEFMQTIAGDKKVRQLWYDGRGVLKYRDRPTRPVWTFTEPKLLSIPQLDYNHADIRNTAFVKGATPNGKAQLTAKRYLPDTHPSGPVAMGRNGKKRYMVEPLEDDTLSTQSAVNSAADTLLTSVQNANVGFEFDSYPVPHLEPGDMFLLSTPGVSINLPMGQYSIPLKAGAQTNGTIKKLSINVAKIRRVK